MQMRADRRSGMIFERIRGKYKKIRLDAENSDIFLVFSLILWYNTFYARNNPYERKEMRQTYVEAIGSMRERIQALRDPHVDPHRWRGDH
jgi:hypothetical protein